MSIISVWEMMCVKFQINHNDMKDKYQFHFGYYIFHGA